MLKIVQRFESLVNGALLCMMAAVVFLATIDLGVLIVRSIKFSPFLWVDIEDLLGLFGSFLLVLIGVELLDTVRTYIAEKHVHVEVILSVGLVAITRKVVILEPKTLEGMHLIGIAAIIIALAVSYYLVRIAQEKRSARSA